MTPLTPPPPTTALRRVLAARPVLRELVIRDLKLRYEGAVLGYFWTVFEPLLLTGIYYVVFGIVGRFGIDDYPLFLILGILPWLWANGTINGASRSISGRGGLFGKVYLPRQLAPLSVTGAKTVEYLASLPIVLLLALIAGRAPDARLLLVPVGWIIQLTFLVGIGLIVSSMNAIANDVERFLRPALRALFYATPILYPGTLASDRFPDVLMPIIWINPLTGPMELYRYAFYPELFVGWGPVVSSSLIAIVFFFVGWATFIRLEPTVLKEI